MKTATAIKIDSKLGYAAINAKQGLITAQDLSLLTGVEAAQLNSYAKKGFLGFYGEYHGKRFFNFEEVVKSLGEKNSEDGEAKSTILATMKTRLQDAECPYSLEKTTADENGNRPVRLRWKEITE